MDRHSDGRTFGDVIPIGPDDVNFNGLIFSALSKGCHLDVVRGPSTPHDPESDAGGSLGF
jgi:hypothetical protein